jgi:hypothetical protein
MCQQEAGPPEWKGELPDEAVLVRGGEMYVKDLTTSAMAHFERHGSYAISLWSYPLMDASEIAQEVGRLADAEGVRLLPNPKMRQTTAGALRALGYAPVPGGGRRGHVTLALDALPDDTEWASLVTAFQPAETNPIALKK